MWKSFSITLPPSRSRKDSFVLLEMMKKASKEEPVLWSNSFVGFGIRRHKSTATGRESDWFRIGFAPRKANLSLYCGSYIDAYAAVLEKLGKYKAGMGCLYVNKLADIDLKVLMGMIDAGWKRK